MDAFAEAEASRRDGEADVLVASDFLPEDWPAKANALFTLAALVEIGLAPPEACPPDVARDPRAWARVAIEASAEMGSPEARLSMADRALRRVGEDGDWFSSDEDSARCAAAMAWLRPAADDAAADAEASGEFHLPRAPPRLRDRDRDAGWTTDAEAEDGWAQVAMEEDLAARGVPEAQRHVGYRRLVGRGMARDEIAAARAFADAAEAGDAAAAFNLGYMHMRGVGVPLDYARAGEPFRRAADANLPAAHNGVGVLRYNGWGTPRDAAAARDAFAAGAAAGDPDAAFNLGALHQSGVGAERNLTRAFELFQVASEAGHWRAPHALASAYLDGAGTSRDCAEAARLFWTFLEERLGWAETQERAVLGLDGTFGEVGDGDGVREKDASEDSADPDGSTDADERAGFLLGRARNPPRNPPRLPPDPWRALATFAALAESGSESAASNAAHMLRRDGAARTFAVDPDDAAARLFVAPRRRGTPRRTSISGTGWDAARAAGGPGPCPPPGRGRGGGERRTEEKRARVLGVPGTSGDPGDPDPRGGGRIQSGESRDFSVLPPRRTSYTAVALERPPRRRSRFNRAAANAGSPRAGTSRGREYTAPGARDPRRRRTSGAARDSQDDIEAVVPALAYAGVGALRVAERFARMAGFERALERQWRWPALVDGEKTERGFDATDRSNAVLDGGGGTTRHTGTDRSRRRATGNLSSGARRAPMEDALLTLLMCGAAAVGMARAAVGRRRDGGVGEPGGGEDRGGVGESRDARRFVAEVAARPLAGAAVVALALAVVAVAVA